MSRRGSGIAAALVLALLLLGCERSGSASRGPARAGSPPSTQGTQPESGASEEASTEPLPHESVTLYFPSATSDGLVEETREILHTSTPGDRAKQIVSDILAGPSDDAAVSFVPAGTRLQQLFVLEDGDAYADFSQELKSGLDGGTDPELLTVYSIVNSVALNVPEIRRVGILVEGRPCESLNGHLDLSRPLKPNRKLVFDARPDGAPPDDKTIVGNDLAEPHRGT